MNIRNSLVVILMLIAAHGNSQPIEGKNMGKVNVSAFALKGFNIQFERQVSHRITVALGYGNIPTSTPAFKSYIKNQINDDNVDLSAFRLGTSVFTPEVRFYVGKKGAFHGFYLAPYARISNYKLQGPINFTSSLEFTRSALFDGKLNSFTGGLMVGSNFNLSKSLYLDWWIVGASIGGARGNFNATIQLTEAEQASLKSSLDDIDVPFTTTQSSVNSNGASVTTNGRMVGVRGLGLNLGIRF